MFLPYGTDAPVYHYPVATIGIIAANTVLFVLTGMGDCGGYDWLILEFDRINPFQWVTSAFMHASWSHLIGNMIFLWCFGLVIEGKLGWKRFSLLYLGLALADGAIGQIPMFVFTDGQGGALGASGVIFALLAVAVIWAPQNDIHFFYVWSWLFYGTIEIPISVVAFFYFAIEFLQVAWTGIRMSTPMLHLLGMSVGIPFAIFMLKHELVDCEGWDLFSRLGMQPFGVGRVSNENDTAQVDSVLHRVHGASKLAVTTAITDATTQAKRDPCATAFEAFANAVRSDRVDESIACFDRLRQNACVAAVPNSTLIAYVNQLSKNDRHRERLLPLRYLASRSSKHSNNARLQIAAIELRNNNDPQAAVRALQELRLPLSSQVASAKEKILRAANTRLRQRQAHATDPTS
ncbi:membrane associated rhomboid family serine protease [Rhodopirellula rubra]|uniref:Membrane associated rhomboid family serine protease n=1 Tax=Aporhodopirellula rubra TaxID=980271 RepID=A0A7W5E1Q8_9BACT|nr:rhomboid family intramembrane serine protease [Aporhodopirellula rubra]MBB3208578.1 membrane associated rhomboid family serine protease [Aporhodopirellula rubra]